MVNYCWCKLNINFVFVLQWVRSNIVRLTFYYTHRKTEKCLRKKFPNKKVQIKYHMTDFVQTYSHLLLKLHSSFSLQGPGAKKCSRVFVKMFFFFYRTGLRSPRRPGYVFFWFGDFSIFFIWFGTCLLSQYVKSSFVEFV